MSEPGAGVDGLVIEVPAQFRCCGTKGIIRLVNGQNTVRCIICDRYTGWNAPKTATGETPRSVSTVRAGITPSARARVLVRARGRCELCRTDLDQVPSWHVEHLLDAAIAFDEGLPDTLINSPENLAAFCEECNLGRKDLIDPLLWLTLMRRRLTR